MLRSVAIVRTDVSEALRSETSVLTIATLRNTPEDGILHNLRHKNLKSYKRYNVTGSLAYLHTL
jgi:hypothetical protein